MHNGTPAHATAPDSPTRDELLDAVASLEQRVLELESRLNAERLRVQGLVVVDEYGRERIELDAKPYHSAIRVNAPSSLDTHIEISASDEATVPAVDVSFCCGGEVVAGVGAFGPHGDDYSTTVTLTPWHEEEVVVPATETMLALRRWRTAQENVMRKAADLRPAALELVEAVVSALHAGVKVSVDELLTGDRWEHSSDTDAGLAERTAWLRAGAAGGTA